MDKNEAKQRLEQALSEVIVQYERFEQAKREAIGAFYVYFELIGYEDELVSKFNHVFNSIDQVYLED